MFFAPFTCSSIGVATDCSTVRASAPVYVATVWIRGGTISGNCATGRRKIITAPVITKKIAITIATIGRLMKNLDIGGQVCGAGVAGEDDGVAPPEPSAAAGSASVGATSIPSDTFCTPSVTTRSPGETPESIILSSPARLPSVTGRSVTLLSAPTTATWYCPCVSSTED